MKKIGLYEFLKLNTEEQHHMTVSEGRFIQFKVEQGNINALYEVGLFFVNLRYRQKKLKMITPFSDGDLLTMHSRFKIFF